MKKVIILIGAVMIMACVAMAGCSFHKNDEEWNALTDVEEYKELLDYPIDKITLRPSVTSPKWAVFDDADLILEWNDYFKSLEIKPDSETSKADNQSLNGRAMAVAVISSNGKEYSIGIYQTSAGCKLELGETVFVTNSKNSPFEKSYKEAVERHGTTSPWD